MVNLDGSFDSWLQASKLVLALTDAVIVGQIGDDGSAYALPSLFQPIPDGLLVVSANVHALCSLSVSQLL